MTPRPLDDDDIPPHDDADMPADDAPPAPADDAPPDDAELAAMPRAWLRNFMASGEYDVVTVDRERVIVPPRPTRAAAERLALIMGFRPYRYAITMPDEAHMTAQRTATGGTVDDRFWHGKSGAAW